MLTWPDYARPKAAAYQENPDFGVLRSDMDNGMATERDRFSLPVVTRQIQFVVSLENKLAFDGWRRNVRATGGWFNWTDPVDNVVKRARIIRNAVVWKPAGNGARWQAELQLESLG